MNDGFLSYLQQLELIAFFAGYPLLYAIVSVIAGGPLLKGLFKTKVILLLSYSYALIGALYLAFQIKVLSDHYSAGMQREQFHLPLIVIWGLLANIFWIPFLAKRRVLSLLHSLPFFFIILKDISLQITGQIADGNIVSNDMKLYSISILINIASLISVSLIHFLYRSFNTKK